MIKTLFLVVVLLAGAEGITIVGGASRRVRRVSTPSASAEADLAPGDPSLVLTTNVALNDKSGFVKASSAAVASCLSKPESYVAVCLTDNHEAMSFGGTTDPMAIGCVYSIGAINQENNAALTKAVSNLLEIHGSVPNDRVYINFFDVPRASRGVPIVPWRQA